MTKADIVDQIAERTGLTKKDVAETVDRSSNAVAAPSRTAITSRSAASARSG